MTSNDFWIDERPGTFKIFFKPQAYSINTEEICKLSQKLQIQGEIYYANYNPGGVIEIKYNPLTSEGQKALEAFIGTLHKRET